MSQFGLTNIFEKKGLVNTQLHLTEAVVEETTKSLLEITAENTKKNKDKNVLESIKCKDKNIPAMESRNKLKL